MTAVSIRVACLSFGILLSGCSSSMGDLLGGSNAPTATPASASADKTSGLEPDLAAANDTEPVAVLYNKGLKNLQKGYYKTAAKDFDEVERQHPYSAWATRAILMAAYSQYMRNSYDDAINAAQRFISLHPGHKDAAYAYYLVAISYYEQIVDVKRDQSVTEKALAALDEVGTRFPGNAYAADAAAKAVLARDHLAGKEMEVGRYYLKRRSLLAAVNRFKTVVIKYQTTTQTPEALYRLTEAYYSLGVMSEAQTAAAVLGHNYPSSQWYKDAYTLLKTGGLEPQENTDSWLSKAWKKVTPG
ncbi:MAG: outer membrane protein assembly factor BamD [Aestuariivirgaceae bacterium]|nr:outer membrane protein assembly factor BamD [Aestuariivirgaceae bacterium]